MSNINDKQLSGYAFTPSQNYLAMSQMALNQFWVKANDTNIIDSLTKGFTQPLDYVNFIRVYPFNVMGTTYDETNVPVPIANKFVNVPNNRTDALLKTSHVGNTKSIIHKQVSFNFGVKSNFSESEPYTTCECFLPYVGFITLASSELYGFILVDLVIDVISGNGTYTISRGDYVIYTTQTSFCVDIALGGTNNINQFRSQFNNGLNALTGIGLTALGITTSNPFVAMGGVETITKAISNIPESQTTYNIKRGTLGGYPTSFNNPHSIYFILKKRRINDYDSFKSVYGKPLNKNYNLNYLKGMTYIPNPKIEIPGITSEEYDSLVGLLQNGVILGLSTEKPIISNVSLSGTYTIFYKHKIEVNNISLSGNFSYTPKVKVSNVSLKGEYGYKHKLEVSNVKLSGTYKEYPQIKVSDIKLSGLYTNLKLNVNNVKLSGLYNERTKVSVSNVKLSGLYTNLKAIVSNVSLSGKYMKYDDSVYFITNDNEYFITSDNEYFATINTIVHKLSISNVSLSGAYSNLKLNVSNVKLSGEYKYIPKVVVSSVKLSGLYTNLKFNVSNVKLNGTYKEYPKVNVSNVKLSGVYTNLNFKVSNVKLSGTYILHPKVNITNVKLSGTYTIYTPTSYTLNLFRYVDNKLKDLKTFDIAVGTTINPSVYAKGYTPSGTTLTSYSPTSSFVMYDNAIIRGYYTSSKVSVSNVKLSGTYTNLKLNVSNVKLKGTYNKAKTKVTNVKLKGTYTTK